MIEKRITHQLLEAGVLALTPAERAALALPEHSTTIDIELEGETFGAQWSGRSRQLTGDKLTERLQDYGQVGGLLRLRQVGQTYRLLLLPPGSEMQIVRPIARPAAPLKAPAGPKAARRRATVDRQFHSDDKYDWGRGQTRTMGFLTEARELLRDQLKAAGFDPLELVELRLQGEELATLDDFEELLAVDVANVDRMPHQEAVARHALSRLRGRAVLADEVGLGKTIEAGLAVKELTLRGLAKRVLVLCPAPLREQWREEMNHKFDLQFDVAYHGPEVGNQEKLIVSLALGTRQAEKLTKHPWDIVIVDEAHRAAGAGARKRRELITALTSACRYAFFLTATPVQNDLLELYRLIELLRPGTFTSVKTFQREFMRGYDPRTPSDPAALRRLISSAMIRTTRAQAGVDRVVRRPVDVPIELGAPERELYALSTDLLRNVMRSPSDTMRRRSLALRLTASPFSMGTTALRMADRHPDERVRVVLSEIGHLAMDISSSARENKALQITHQWIREHGRVLVFTQHTDTVTGLLRRMEAEGLTARAFHGSMSASERAATIAAFRSGEAPVMISTDAGAEGQNLQFCNCVLNYDLPWNPMRIEQRIGRVDRLTQPRDEVFVANLYACRTIDESVYRLLAEKLRMFELLFGQVTTILGELDDSKSATFETRVLDALFAESDAKMERLLTQLGTELADARERAGTLIAADGDLSSWMTAAFEHRKGLTKAGSAELMPELTERARRRQRRVQTWVRRVLEALGAQVLHDTGDGEGAFLTVQFDEEFEEELGGRTLMHLAFDRHGLEHHPDAELCAVGSPVFDELLGLLRMRGDMHATVPVIPDDLGPSPFRHAPTIRLIRRRLIPAGTWSGQATFRATVGEAETTEHIITAEINGANDVRLPRRPLSDGEVLPATFQMPSEIVAEFEREAARRLEKIRRDRAEEVEQQQRQELDRVRRSYQARIAEALYEDEARLRRALKSEERRLSRRPDVRARAKLLAMTLDEDDWIVEETWAAEGDVEATLTYEWGFSEPPEVESDASQRSIAVLALCSGAHWVDETETTRCGSCDFDLCAACGDDAVFADCPVCGVASCGSCRQETGGLCLRCGSPGRAPEFDTEFAVAWRLGREAILFVGERAAELTRPGEPASSLLVRDEDVADPDRIRLRAYAVQNGLPADSGLVLRDLSRSPTTDNPSRLRLRRSENVRIELSIAANPTSEIDRDALADLPEHAAATVDGESDLKLVSLLEKLRHEVPPPTPPCVLVTRRSTFTDVYLEAEGLVEQVSAIADDGTLNTVDEHSASFEWRESSLQSPELAEAELGGLRVVLERRNDAVLVSAYEEGHSDKTSQWIALPDGFSAASQLGWFGVLESLGASGGRVGQRTNEIREVIGPVPVPMECQLLDRRVRPVVEVAMIDAEIDLVPVDSDSLRALGAPSNPVSKPLPGRLPAELNRALLERTARSFTAVVRNGFEIHEIWRGHGTATHEYRTFDGRPTAPTLDDIGAREVDFGVCRDGHFYAAGRAALCASCRTWSCMACDEIDHQASIGCPGCSASICRRCLSEDHVASTAICVLCGDTMCSECGRDPQVHCCPICDREVCSSCRVGELCPACSRLGPATDDELSCLPVELAATGAAVLAGVDKNAMTVILNRGGAIEQAVVRNGSLDRWIAFGRSMIDDAYKLRLSASRLLNTQVVPIVEPLDREARIDAPHLVLQSDRIFFAVWSVEKLGRAGRGANPFVNADGDLPHLVAREFPPLTRLPQPAAKTPAQVDHVVASIPQHRSIDLTLRWHRVGHDVLLVDSGILTRRFDGSSLHEKLTRWASTGATPPWVTQAWQPAPTVYRYAVSDIVEVVIVGMASLRALGVRADDRPEWYAISGSQQAPAATMLGRWMGIGDADEVSAFTDPNRISLSSVSNAMHISRRVRPLGSIQPTSRPGHPRTTPNALAAWLPGAHVVTPELGILPNDFRLLLVQQLNTEERRTALVIGAHVEEAVTVEDGQVWVHEANLRPGTTDARRIDSTTTLPRDHGVIDREGHFVPDAPRCRYCGGRICPVCLEGMVSCDCCAAPICKRCANKPKVDLWLCPACATLRRATRREARQHGRFLLTRGMLIGADPVHTVIVEHTKHRWMRHAEDGAQSVIESPVVEGFLNERLTDGDD